MAEEHDPVRRAEAALGTLIVTLGRHRTLARVFAVEANGAGPTFRARVTGVEDEFVALVKQELDAAVAEGAIDPIDTVTVAHAWVGMLNAVLTRWALGEDRRSIERVYPEIRRMLLRSVGADERDEGSEGSHG